VCRPEFTGEDSRSIAYMIDTFFKPMVVGADPLHHLTILDRVDRIRDCRAAKSLIDIALWDLRGKLLGEPVSGGCSAADRRSPSR
jgi:L-Ala-D/L-Glu epimerase / N-acetyl-D-glutamate racemase